jgi:hypothetical protein
MAYTALAGQLRPDILEGAILEGVYSAQPTDGVHF